MAAAQEVLGQEAEQRHTQMGSHTRTGLPPSPHLGTEAWTTGVGKPSPHACLPALAELLPDQSQETVGERLSSVRPIKAFQYKEREWHLGDSEQRNKPLKTTYHRIQKNCKCVPENMVSFGFRHYSRLILVFKKYRPWLV